jgi:hypothetical protein
VRLSAADAARSADLDGFDVAGIFKARLLERKTGRHRSRCDRPGLTHEHGEADVKGFVGKHYSAVMGVKFLARSIRILVFDRYFWHSTLPEM